MDTKLYIKDDEYITLPLKRPTMQVKDALLKLNLEYASEQQKIMQQDKFAGVEKIQELMLQIEQGKSDDMSKALMLINNPDNAVLIQEYTIATQRIADEFALKKFKEVIDVKKIEDEEIKKQFNSAVSSAFWKNQDMEEVNEALSYFRTKLGLG